MARVTHQKSAKQNGASGSTRGGQIAKQRNNKKQKVVVQSSAQGQNGPSSVVSKTKLAARGHIKDKPRAHPRQLSFHTEPPPGYTFIPAGNPQLTNALKEFAKKENHKIFSVSTTPHATRHELSREVHRIGFHFPTSVVAQVCNHYGIRLTRDGRLIDEDKSDNLFMKVYQKGQLVLDEKVQDQVTINTEAKETIKDLFPNIPDKDLFKIIKTAFQLGDGKVGTADEIPLHRRATLSVVAHIRHCYTEYDRLLRRMPYNNARHEVEGETLKILVEWRGDGKAAEGAINDILDDVIVISDEEASDPEPEGVQQVRHDDLRVEELDGNAYWPAQARPISPARAPLGEVHSGYRYLPQAVQPYRLSEAEIAARERNRAARWERAQQEYRLGMSQAGPSYQRVLIREPSPVRRLIPIDEPLPGRAIERDHHGSMLHRPHEVEVGFHPASVAEMLAGIHIPVAFQSDGSDLVQVLSRPESPMYPRPAGVRYERMVDDFRPPPPAFQPQSRPPTPSGGRYRRRSASPSGGDENIVPSIEGPNGGYSPSIARQNEVARARNQQVAAGYRDRREQPDRRGSPVNFNNADDTRYRRTEGELANTNPFHSTLDRPRVFRDLSPRVSEAGTRPLDPQASARRIILAGDDLRFDHIRSQHPPRLNPFQDRNAQEVRRLEPLPPPAPFEILRRPNPETPPRRILEPIPADDPYSDAGPQRYREYVPAPEPYYASAPPSTYTPAERRVVYANPPEDYVVERRHGNGMNNVMPVFPPSVPANGFARYEPLPGTNYTRR